jgi:hypothetical protein
MDSKDVSKNNNKKKLKIQYDKEHTNVIFHDAQEGYTRNTMRCSNEGSSVYLPSGTRGA